MVDGSTKLCRKKGTDMLTNAAADLIRSQYGLTGTEDYNGLEKLDSV